MKFFVDHGSYDLQNLGDLAMLKSLSIRIKDFFPDARVVIPMVGDSLSLTREFDEHVTFVDIRETSPSEKYFLHRLFQRRAIWFRLPDAFIPPAIRSLRRELLSADVVIAAGGGYFCDSFWNLAELVMMNLREGARRGKIVGCVGQGFGPIEAQHRQKKLVDLKANLDFLYLRTPAYQVGSGFEDVAVLGDDALEFSLVKTEGSKTRGSIGFNVRDAGYVGSSESSFSAVGDAVRFYAEEEGLSVQPLPIALGDDLDLGSIERACGMTDFGLDCEQVSSIDTLISAVDRCAVTVTSSYHAALFSLARGVPVVGLVSSSYYEGKFSGLRSIYGPKMMRVFPLAGFSPEAFLLEVFDTQNVDVKTKAQAVRMSLEMRYEQRLFLRDSLIQSCATVG